MQARGLTRKCVMFAGRRWRSLLRLFLRRFHLWQRCDFQQRLQQLLYRRLRQWLLGLRPLMLWPFILWRLILWRLIFWPLILWPLILWRLILCSRILHTVRPRSSRFPLRSFPILRYPLLIHDLPVLPNLCLRGPRPVFHQCRGRPSV